MTAFAAIIYKHGDARVDESIYDTLVSRLNRQLNGYGQDNVSTDMLKADKFWLPHSRTRGICHDKESGSWLACIGNPFGQKYQTLTGYSYSRQLLKDYLNNGIAAITELSAPFVIVVYDGRDRSFHIVTDRVGLQHIYFYEHPDYFILSTSSMALASVLKVCLNREALASYFMAGYLMGQNTFFEGIQKVEGAVWIRIKDGRIDKSRYWSPPFEQQDSKSITYYAGELADKFQKAVSSRLDENGRTSVELTSGMDSRMNLACAVACQKPFHAWTIGQPNSPEVKIAQKLCQVQNFEHHVFSACKDLDKSFLDDLRLISGLIDSETDCLNLISSPCCNRRSAQLRDSSISGLAGEILRGPYYPYFKGLSNNCRKVNVSRIINFKMLDNVCSDKSVFSSAFPSDSKGLVKSQVENYFQGNTDKPLRWRLDNYYYSGAVQRFVGRSCSFNNYFYRQELPFFDNDIIDLSFRLPHQYKKNSKLLKHALLLCNRGYSEVLLENGLPARPLHAADLKRLMVYYTNFGLKIWNRLNSSFLGRSRVRLDNAGIYHAVTSILGSDKVLELLDWQNMSSSFLYQPDNLKCFVKKNINNGFKDRTQIGLMLSFELLCRYLGRSLKA